VTERKKGNKHLLEACKDKHVNAGRARKVTERKVCSKHLLEVWEAIFKYDEKGRKKGEKARKVTERKMCNMHLLEAVKVTYVKAGR
jgi:sulfite reductase beta subunit-like hemoprotein